MGWRFRKSIRILPGIRVNLSEKGMGHSIGVPGYRRGRTATGKKYSTVSIPGTGLYKTEFDDARRPQAPSPEPREPTKSNLATAIISVFLLLAGLWAGLSYLAQ